jgi:phosphoribosylformimino-5-aminoimidazole carboxamide ribonucleotide (ProFAR) isomerase
MTITLKFPKKDLKCSLGLQFLGEFLDEVDLSLEDVGEKMQKNPFKLLPAMIYTSARVEAELSGEDFKMTKKDVIEVLESGGGISSPEIAKFINAWTDSLTSGVPKSEPAEEGGDSEKK